MLSYILDWIFKHRVYVENIRIAIVDYEYDKTQEKLDNICKHTHRLACYYKDFFYDKHDQALGEFLWALQHKTGSELTLSIYNYQQWLNERVRPKWVLQLKKLVAQKF